MPAVARWHSKCGSSFLLDGKVYGGDMNIRAGQMSLIDNRNGGADILRDDGRPFTIVPDGSLPVSAGEISITGAAQLSGSVFTSVDLRADVNIEFALAHELLLNSTLQNGSDLILTHQGTAVPLPPAAMQPAHCSDWAAWCAA